MIVHFDVSSYAMNFIMVILFFARDTVGGAAIFSMNDAVSPSCAEASVFILPLY